MQELIGLMLFALISRDWSSRVVPVKVGSDPRNDPLSVTWNGAHTSNYSAMKTCLHCEGSRDEFAFE